MARDYDDDVVASFFSVPLFPLALIVVSCHPHEMLICFVKDLFVYVWLCKLYGENEKC